MVKDERLRQLIERAKQQTKSFQIAEGLTIEIPRLTINDCVRLEKELGVNLFGVLMDMARTGSGSAMSYEFQRTIFYHALKKTNPDITIEEAGDVMSLMNAADLGRALAWILVGTEVPA